MDEKLVHKLQKRLEQICSSLLSEGWRELFHYEVTNDPVYGYTAMVKFAHRRGRYLVVFVEDAQIEIWRNGKLRHSESVTV